MKSRICNIDFNQGPCKIIDLKNGRSLCNFIERFAELSYCGENEELDRLIKQICPDMRDQILHHKCTIKQNKKIAKYFLNHVKPGDIVFCTSEIYGVEFIEYPSHKFGDYKYKNIDGVIQKAPSSCFRIISKGDKYAEYKTKDKEKAEDYSRLARRNGYRVEKEKLEDTYVLKIYRDTQEEVDLFVENLNNDLVLYDFYDF